MYIRRKKNKSGSSSVFIVDKSRGEYRVVKKFGVGRTEEELELLEQRANQYLLEAKGLAQSLFEKTPDIPTDNFVMHLSNEQLRSIGPELIYGRLYDKVGFGRLQNELFRHLVVSHLFSPNSKMKSVEYLQRFIGKNHGIHSIYRFLDNVSGGIKEKTVIGKDIKKVIEDITLACFQKAHNGKITPVFSHLLPLCFEADEGKELRKMAIPKKNKHDIPQLYLCLLTDSDCNPVGYELFDENALQDNSFIHAIRHLNKRCGLTHSVVVADAALFTKSLEGEHCETISGTDLKNEPEDIRQHILNLALQDDEMAEIAKDGGYRLIVSKSSELADIDRLKRERGLKRLQQKIKLGRLTYRHINNRGFNKYLKLKGKTKVVIDMDKCRLDATWDGITGYLTNSSLRPEEVIENHNHYNFIKQAFRMYKSDLLIRPVCHGLQNRIEALICICFTAFTIRMELKKILKTAGSTISLKQAQEITSTLYSLARYKESKRYIQNIDKQQAVLFRMVVNS